MKNYLGFRKNDMKPPYKKLQPLISAFMKNSIFGENRDPCLKVSPHFYSFFLSDCSYSELCQQDQLPCCLAQDCPREAKAIKVCFSLVMVIVVVFWDQGMQKML